LFKYTANASNQGRVVTISDTFDFELDRNGRYGTLFRSLVNNWGWLSQNMSVLYPVKITIKIKNGL